MSKKPTTTANPDRKNRAGEFIKLTKEDNLPPQEKVDKAICYLIRKEAFYAHLIQRCVKEWRKDMPTMAVSFQGSDFYLFLNENYVNEITMLQCIGDLKHEMLHLIAKHLSRGMGYQQMPYNVAADMAIDQFIRNDHEFKAYRGIYPDDKHFGWAANRTAEQYYQELLKSSKQHEKCKSCAGTGVEGAGQGQGQGDKQDQQGQGQGQGDQPGDGDGEGEGDGQQQGQGQGGGGHQHDPNGPPCPDCKGSGSQPSSTGGQRGEYYDPSGRQLGDIPGYDNHKEWTKHGDCDVEYQDEKIKQIVTEAYNATKDDMRTRGLLPAFVEEYINNIHKTDLPWKKVLSQFMYKATLADITWTRKRPNRRYGFQYPATRNDPRLSMIIAIDTSGSVGTEDLAAFFGEIEKIKGLNHKITIIECDAQVGNVYDYKKLPKTVSGRGGTCFTPVFEYIKRKKLRPNCMIYLTDGYGDSPMKPRGYPVLWCYTPNHSKPVTWGNHICLKY